MKSLLVFVISLLIPFVVEAQVEVEGLVTDRPDQTESTRTVLPGWVQIETGVLWEKGEIREEGSETSTQILSYPTTLVRIGLRHSFELRLAGQWEKETFTSDGQETSSEGVSGAAFGGKLRLTGPVRPGWIPEMAVVAHLERDSAGNEDGAVKWVPRVLVAVAHDLSDRAGFSWNVGGSWESDEAGGSMFFTAALGGDLTGKVGGFVEVFGIRSGGSEATIHFDTGVTSLWTPHLQLDAAAGLAITGDFPYWFLNAGFSYRFRL